MGTSRSGEGTREWTATAEIFSGRRDPTWVVPEETITWLLGRWDELDVASEVLEPSGLGYRGVTLKEPEGSAWVAYGGVVVRKANGIEMRADPERSWERALVGAAPPGLLPPIDLEV